MDGITITLPAVAGTAITIPMPGEMVLNPEILELYRQHEDDEDDDEE